MLHAACCMTRHESSHFTAISASAAISQPSNRVVFFPRMGKRGWMRTPRTEGQRGWIRNQLRSFYHERRKLQSQVRLANARFSSDACSLAQTDLATKKANLDEIWKKIKSIVVDGVCKGRPMSTPERETATDYHEKNNNELPPWRVSVSEPPPRGTSEFKFQPKPKKRPRLHQPASSSADHKRPRLHQPETRPSPVEEWCEVATNSEDEAERSRDSNQARPEPKKMPKKLPAPKKMPQPAPKRLPAYGVAKLGFYTKSPSDLVKVGRFLSKIRAAERRGRQIREERGWLKALPPHVHVEDFGVRVDKVFDFDWTKDSNRRKEMKKREKRDQLVKAALQDGRTISFCSSGNSLWPWIHSGDCCTYEPVTTASQLKLLDVVFCEVQPPDRRSTRKPAFFAHVIAQIKQREGRRAYYIHNLRGHLNGHCFIEHIYGKMIHVRKPT